MIERFVTNEHGTWDVVHPFTGRVEFSTTERYLADAVGKDFDRRDPLTEEWFLAALYALPPEARRHAQWVMSTKTMQSVRKLKTTAGEYLWLPVPMPDLADSILGRPVRIDEAAVGITLKDSRLSSHT